MPTYVTRPFLPPLSEVLPYIEDIWENRVLSNGGKYHQEFERGLEQFLKVDHLSLANNGTSALLLALKSLDIEGGEVITTPYSFVATANAILWNSNTPVFVDIEPSSVNIDPRKIESAITDKTKAILAVHCYGHPCATEAIAEVAKRYGLKVIYDGAHAFGVETDRGGLLQEGDLSIVSFHATKPFNTFEGGAVICHSKEAKEKIDRLKNFGFAGEMRVDEPGFNAKMNELVAAVGIVQLQYYRDVQKKRQQIDARYRSLLTSCDGIRCLKNEKVKVDNYSYFPVRVENSFPIERDELVAYLAEKDIFARRYFYPLIPAFEAYRGFPSSDPKHLVHAHEMAEKVICLPIFPEMDLSLVDDICQLIDDNRVRR